MKLWYVIYVRKTYLRLFASHVLLVLLQIEHLLLASYYKNFDIGRLHFLE